MEVETPRVGQVWERKNRHDTIWRRVVGLPFYQGEQRVEWRHDRQGERSSSFVTRLSVWQKWASKAQLVPDVCPTCNGRGKVCELGTPYDSGWKPCPTCQVQKTGAAK